MVCFNVEFVESDPQNDLSFSCPDSFQNFNNESPACRSRVNTDNDFVKRWRSGNVNMDIKNFQLELPQNSKEVVS